MRLKKANAITTWVLSGFFILHLCTISLSLLTGWRCINLCLALAGGTATAVSIHVILCLIIFFFHHDGTVAGKNDKARKLVQIQRGTAIFITCVLHLHLSAFGFISAGQPLAVGQKIFIIVTELLFFNSCITHLAVSFPKSLITLGMVKRDEQMPKIFKITNIICLLLRLLSAVAITVFIIGWTGFVR